jgi:hypothetical protein
VKVSWDDDIPNMMGKIENVPNHQPVIGDVTDVSEVICG